MSIELTGLSWLRGNWIGWGIWDGFGLSEQVVIETLHITDDGGPYLIATSTQYLADGGEIRGDASAARGAQQLVRGQVWAHETLYLRIAPTQAGQDRQRYDAEVMLANPAGYVGCAPAAVGVGDNVAELRFRMDNLTHTTSGAQVETLERNYLLRDDELYVRATMSAFGQHDVPYLQLRLGKEETDAE